MTVLDLMMLLEHFPMDAKVHLLAQVPGSETVAVRVELADPLMQGHERGRSDWFSEDEMDWFEDEITEVDPLRSRFG